MTHSYLEYLKVLQHPVTEVRILRADRYLAKSRTFTGETISGYYTADSYDKIQEDIRIYDADPGTKGIYTTLHACNPALLARAENRLRLNAKDTTSDHEITAFSAFPIDIDPDRPAGISSSDAELEIAKVKAQEIAEFLESLGLSLGKAKSGNGFHILAFLEPLPCKEESISSFKGVGDLVASHFGTDTTIYNPARIWKLYGTIARKGDDTEERPHRRAEMKLPDELVRIPFSELSDRIHGELEVTSETSIPDTPSPAQNQQHNTKGKADITLREWLDQYKIAYREKPYKNGASKYQVDCPHDPSHKMPDAWLTDEGGAWQFSCSHDSCKGERSTWKAFKKAHRISETPQTKRRTGKQNGTPMDNEAPLTSLHGLPVIPLTEEDEQLGYQQRLRPHISDQAFAHLKGSDDFVVRGGELGRVEDTGESVFSFEPAENRHITSYISRKAVFVAVSNNGVRVQANPPNWVADDILTGQDLSEIPTLKLIVSHPIYFEGEILDFEGFDRRSGYFRPASSYVKPIYPETSAEATEVLLDLLCDFPFSEEADYENALSIPLTMILRPSFPAAELVPLCAINAASPGTGKSALAKALFSPLLPTEAAVTPLSNDKEEIRKAVFTKLREGKNYVIFDNLDQSKTLDSGLIASVISEPYHTDRLLGGNTSGTYQNHLVPLYTGNNIQASPELVDRGFLVSLQSPPERSADRDFKHKQLFAYARQQRAKTLGALLFMVRKWREEGEPLSEHKHRMSYWATCIGGVLEANGLGEGFLSNMMKFRRETDAESPQWARAFAAIYDRFEDHPWSLKDVFTILSYEKSYYNGKSHVPEHGSNLLGNLYVDVPNSNAARRTRVGLLLKSRIGQTLAGYQLCRDGTRNNANQYKIQKFDAED